MKVSLLTVSLYSERDVVQARQRAREIAALLGFDNQDQIRLATATSEMARNAFRYARNGKVLFSAVTPAPQLLEITVSDSGPGISQLDEVLEGRYHSTTGMGLGIIGTKKLMDNFEISTGTSGTLVHMSKVMPVHAPVLAPGALSDLINKIAARPPESPYEEVERQNQELLKTFQHLRSRQEELATLNQELEDTNRGVVALYAELDERADYLRRASELKTSFLANVSHEFRTPLNSIISLSRMLLERQDGDLTGEQAKQINFISKAARSLSELVNDLLDLAKVEAGKVKIRVKTFQVPELFGALKGMLKPLLADNNSVDLIFEDVAGLPACRTDEGKVSQILRNFISNAIKFTPQGEVRISAEFTAPGAITFKVRDTGIGIAPAHKESIFKEFTQVDNPLQDRHRGTGLGLPLCRNLAILLGGKVWVESEPGQGSSFFARIPVLYSGESADVPELVSDGVASVEFHRAAVLLIDDNVESFTFLELQLRNTEYQLIHMETLERAQRWLERHQPVAIIADIYLDGIPSWDFLKLFKASEAGRNIPVVAMSMYDDGSRAASTGVDLFLKKPLERKVLLQELRRLTRRERPRRLLLVDDNQVSLYILRELLDRPWLELLEAKSGQEAIATINREQPDAVILDLVMPGLDGFQVLKHLRSNRETLSLPVIVYTSKELSSSEQEQIANLASGVIKKDDVSSTLAPELLLDCLATIGISEPGRF
jgi:signal transduction histidine kinase/CheY-like chemotaxis protein